MPRAAVFVLMSAFLLGGCMTVATYQATTTLCSKDNIHCGNTPEKEHRYPEQAARKAFEADREIAAAVVDTFRRESDDPTWRATAAETCAEGQQRICSAANGCLCEPESTGLDE